LLYNHAQTFARASPLQFPKLRGRWRLFFLFFVRFFFIWFSRERERDHTQKITSCTWTGEKKAKKSEKVQSAKKKKSDESKRESLVFIFSDEWLTREGSLSTVFFFQEKSLYSLLFSTTSILLNTRKTKTKRKVAHRATKALRFARFLLTLFSFSFFFLRPSKRFLFVNLFNFRIKKERDPLERSKNTNEEEEEKIETSSNLTTRFLFLFFEITSKTH